MRKYECPEETVEAISYAVVSVARENVFRNRIMPLGWAEL
jgi:hypothetical protein